MNFYLPELELEDAFRRFEYFLYFCVVILTQPITIPDMRNILILRSLDYRKSVHIIQLLKKKIRLYRFGKEFISCLSRANVRAFHENPDRIYTELTFIYLKAHKKSFSFCCLYDKQCRSRSDCSCWSSMIWVHTVCLYTYVNQ